MKTKITLVALALIMSAASLHAQIDGRTIMDNVYNRPTGNTMQATLRMQITNARGATRDREIVQYSIDTAEGEKKIMFFENPADVRGTSFMTWSWDDGRDDDQWIYLPALKRVKRIASDSKNDSFMGSDFTYDDLGDRHPSEDTHTLIGEETVDGLPCYVVESVPLEKNPAYAKTITRIHKDSWVGLRKEYFDSRGELVKVLEIGKREKIDGFWVVTDMTMKDLDRGSSTRITMNAVRFDIPLNDQLFSERQMRIGQPR